MPTGGVCLPLSLYPSQPPELLPLNYYVTFVNAHVMDNASWSFVDVCVATLPTFAPALRQELLVDADAPHAAMQEALWSI